MVPRKTEEKWEPIDSLGITGATVARNIRRVRLARGLAYTELADQLALLQREIPTWGLRKIESGGRRVDVDDLMAMASALGVSPVTFLMPDRNEDGSEIQEDDVVPITGWLKPITAKWAWEWLTARHALASTKHSEFIAQAWPAWLQEQFWAGVTKMRRRQAEELGPARRKLLEGLYRQVPEGDVPEGVREILGGSDGDD